MLLLRDDSSHVAKHLVYIGISKALEYREKLHDYYATILMNEARGNH